MGYTLRFFVEFQNSKPIITRFFKARIFFVTLGMGPFIYYVITFLGFLDPSPPLRQHVFSTK